MAYNVVYKKSVHRDIKKMPRSEARRILDQIEHKLTKKPESNSMLKDQFAGLRRYCNGDYGIIYALMGANILVLRIGNRRYVYKGKI